MVIAAGAVQGSRHHTRKLIIGAAADNDTVAAHEGLALQATHLAVRILHSILLKIGTPAPALPSSLVKLLLMLCLTTTRTGSGGSLSPNSATPASPLAPKKLSVRKRNKDSSGNVKEVFTTAVPLSNLEIAWAPVVAHVVDIVQTLGLDMHNRDTIWALLEEDDTVSAGDATALPRPLMKPMALSTSKRTINLALITAQVKSLNAYLQPSERPPVVPTMYQPNLC